MTAEPAWVCAGLPAISGRLREEQRDFVVVERLAYELDGEGTHSFLRVRKTGLSSFEAVRRLARALGRREREVGYAGLKDRHAVTEQWLSIEHLDQSKLSDLEIPGLELLEVTRHRNKLKMGHLRGNRFEIRVRGAAAGDGERAMAMLQRLAERGLPNAFGAQRFGHGGVTPRLGQALLTGEFPRFFQLWTAGEDALGEGPEALLARGPGERMLRDGLMRWRERGDAEWALRGVPKRFLSLCTAALQSEVFNEVLRRRLPELGELLPGDIAFLHRNGACFAVEDAAAEQARAASFEISPSGPQPGPACLRATGQAGEIEDAVLEQFAVSHELFDVRDPWGQKGGRRALRVSLPPESLAAKELDDGGERCVELAFELGRGSFATAVLAELLRDEALR